MHSIEPHTPSTAPSADTLRDHVLVGTDAAGMRYRTIVVGTDGSASAAIAVGRAADLARSAGAVLHLVSAISEPIGALVAASTGGLVPGGDWAADVVADRERRIGELAASLRAAGLEVMTHVERGDAATTLVAMTRHLGADLLVVGDRGLKGLRGLLGSVPSSVAHRALTDVLVVHTS